MFVLKFLDRPPDRGDRSTETRDENLRDSTQALVKHFSFSFLHEWNDLYSHTANHDEPAIQTSRLPINLPLVPKSVNTELLISGTFSMHGIEQDA